MYFLHYEVCRLLSCATAITVNTILLYTLISGATAMTILFLFDIQSYIFSNCYDLPLSLVIWSNLGCNPLLWICLGCLRSVLFLVQLLCFFLLWFVIDSNLLCNCYDFLSYLWLCLISCATPIIVYYFCFLCLLFEKMRLFDDFPGVVDFSWFGTWHVSWLYRVDLSDWLLSMSPY